MKTFVKKRDGSLQPWDARKIKRALFGAFNEVQPGEIPNIDDLELALEGRLLGHAPELTVEVIQDEVVGLLRDAHPKVADAYERYRRHRAEVRDRRLKPDPEAVANYIHASKYAKYRKSDRRREVYEETVDRSFAMHYERFVRDCRDEKLAGEIHDAFDLAREKKILPSMRSMQFGGDAIVRNNSRMYNCAFTLANRGRVFAEIFHALLSGCGVGYSVQFQHVEALPEVRRIDNTRVKHFTVPDTIEGWADALLELCRAYYKTGEYVEFNYSQIRAEGATLSTGGRAPGHTPLKAALEKIRAKFDAATGRKMRPIEVHDVICFTAEAVLSGGIRRSSLISLFSAHDSEMMYAKAHENFRPASKGDSGVNSQRQMANNSVALLRSATHWDTFERVVKVSKEWGDPGFYFTDNLDFGCNPCGEIGLYPKLKGKWDGVDRTLDFDYDEYQRSGGGGSLDAINDYGHDTGFQFCNLCEVNVAAIETPAEFIDACKKAALIGTLQAAYTDFYYLGPVTRRCVEDESLLGVGMTGIMDRPEIGLNPRLLKEGAEAAVAENRRVAQAIGIRPAARVTTVKPSGTASLELGGVGSGIHYHHARRYFRRITANPNESIAQAFKKANPHMVETKPNGDLCLVFPIVAPDGAKVVKEESGLEFMDHVFNVYESWVKPGSLTLANKLMLTHNVSCTVVVRDEEWDLAVKKAWVNRHRVTAMSFMPLLGDKIFPFAPREEVVTDADEAKWNYLIEHYTPVDYKSLQELHDDVNFTQDPACAGGVCEI